jgi:hypothetical protein
LPTEVAPLPDYQSSDDEPLCAMQLFRAYWYASAGAVAIAPSAYHCLTARVVVFTGFDLSDVCIAALSRRLLLLLTARATCCHLKDENDVERQKHYWVDGPADDSETSLNQRRTSEPPSRGLSRWAIRVQSNTSKCRGHCFRFVLGSGASATFPLTVKRHATYLHFDVVEARVKSNEEITYTRCR